MQNTAGRVAVITGGASGIGLAMARRFASAGMHVVLADIDQAGLDKAVSKLSETGAKVTAQHTDVSNEASVKALADAVFQQHGKVHILCNNAGVSSEVGPSWEQTRDDWDWVLKVNLWGVVHGIRHFVPQMLAGGDEGHIINTSSMGGHLSMPLAAPYNVTKFAVVAMSESLHHEFAMQQARLRVSLLCPGFVRTNIAYSARHRPDGTYRGLSTAAREITRGYEQVIAAGIEPSKVADAVMDAITHNRFYVFTHPELLPAVKNRAQRMIDGKPPYLSLPM